jgi:hypothetical protein
MLKRRETLRLGLLLVLFATAAVSAQNQTRQTLTNDDIIKMVQAQLSTSIILATMDSANVNFDLSPNGLIALKQAGVDDQMIAAMQAKSRARESGTTTNAVTRSAPEKSDSLATSKDPQYILRNFRTIVVDASRAKYFGNAQMKGALGQNKDFVALKLSLVDDPSVADAILEVGYTYAWDYPFSLKHQNTSVVLVSGKGTGPFSGPLGATSVAIELVKLLKPYRGSQPAQKGK